MNQVPSELYHLILSYYTNKCKTILLLRVLSKSWKEITEHSLLWLECPLQFSAPRAWILPSRSGVFTLPLYSDYQASLQSTFRTILIDRGNQVNESEVTDVTRNPFHPFLRNIPNRHQQAYDIAQYYLRVYTFYHKNWWKYHRLASRLTANYDNLRVYLPIYMTCSKIIGTLLLALSSYFLMYLSIESVTSWKTILGFMFIFLYLLLYLIGFIFQAYQKILSHYLYTLIQDNITSFEFYMNIELVLEMIIEDILMTLFIIELILVILLIYIKLIYIHNITFLWVYTTIPLWIFPMIIIILMLKYLQTKIEGIHFVVTFFGYFFYSIALTALLFAIHYDNPSLLPSLGVALIPLFPLVLLEMVWTMKGGYKAMSEIILWIDRELSRRSPRFSRCWWFLSRTFPDMCLEPDSNSYYLGRRALKRFWNIVFRLMAMLVTVCLIVLVYIPNGLKNVALTFNQSNLPSGAGLILTVVLFLQCAWLPDMRDTF
eukprot:gene12348-13500_t